MAPLRKRANCLVDLAGLLQGRRAPLKNLLEERQVTSGCKVCSCPLPGLSLAPGTIPLGVNPLTPVLRETVAIVGWTFWWTSLAGLFLRFTVGWPFLVTYFFGILTVGPFLAVWRGRDRARDPLSLTQRAMAELLALVVLLALGMTLERLW